MLNERYIEAENNKGDDWKKLDRFFKDLDIDRSAFISMNWDTVIERRVTERRKLNNFDSVSYTHLDVYKRQLGPRAIATRCLSGLRGPSAPVMQQTNCSWSAVARIPSDLVAPAPQNMTFCGCAMPRPITSFPSLETNPSPARIPSPIRYPVSYRARCAPKKSGRFDPRSEAPSSRILVSAIGHLTPAFCGSATWLSLIHI